MGERFWLEEPRDLFARLSLLPQDDDTLEERLNTITRLVIVLAVIGAICKWKYWLTFLIVALSVVVFVFLVKRSETQCSRMSSNPKRVKSKRRKPKKAPPVTHFYTHIIAPPEVPRNVSLKIKKKSDKSPADHQQDFYRDADLWDPDVNIRDNLFRAVL